VKRALALVKAGAIGDVFGGRLPAQLNYRRIAADRYHPVREGGYPFRDLGVHALY